MLKKALWIIWIDRLGYSLGAISIILGGFSWWIIGCGVGTYWAHGAAKLAAQKQNSDTGSKWEMQVHFFIHLAVLSSLIGFSINNLLK